MIEAVDIVVDRAVGHAIERVATWSHLREDHIVASLFLHALPTLRVQMAALFGGGVSLNGVFCHNRPQVRWGSSRRCELGDVLIVVAQVGDRTTLRSLLLQHKIQDKTLVPAAQAELYADWPKFQYEHASDVERDVEPKSPHRGAQFSMIDVGSHRADVRDRPADGPRATLGSEVGLMANTARRGGRAFQPEALRTSDDSQWSLVVWDLLRTTFGRADFTLKKAGAIEQPRVVDRGDAVLFADAAGPPRFLLQSSFGETVQRTWDRGVAPAGDGPLTSLAELPPLRGDEDDNDVYDPGGVSLVVVEIDRR